MSLFDVIAFDADDTLWHNEHHETTWLHEVTDPPPTGQPGFYQLEHLGQLPALLDQLQQKE